MTPKEKLCFLCSQVGSISETSDWYTDALYDHLESKYEGRDIEDLTIGEILKANDLLKHHYKAIYDTSRVQRAPSRNIPQTHLGSA
jgi:hypothetical protein